MMRKIVVLLTLASTAPLLAQTATGPAAEAPFLPIAKVVLYKSGVGYFEHLGTVTGSPRVAVQFTGAQLDDVLKSLTTLDLGDGRVVGVSYESPTPIERRLQALRLPLDQSASTLDFMTALRGARIEVVQSSGVGVTGRLLGIERRSRSSNPSTPPSEIDELTVVTDRGEVLSLPMNGVRVRVLDAGLRQEVGRYLDVAASARDLDARRMIISTAGTASRQLFVSYITEAAVWKTTYRLVFPTTGNREPILQGWAIVDNMGAQDWENVELSLVAGAPQSFVQPLSQPLFTRRPSVALPTGLLPTPQEHAGALTVTNGAAALQGTVTDPQGLPMPGVTITVTGAARQSLATTATDSQGQYRLGGLPGGVVTLRAELQGFRTTELNSLPLVAGQTRQQNFRMQVGAVQEVVAVTAESTLARGGTGGGVFRGVGGGAGPGAAVPRDAVEQRFQDVGPAASGSELGELFEYRLTDRVTIRRNQSALVPILQARVTAERVSLWNESMGSRPRRAVWLTNSSALTLDAGSVSVADAGAFAGEGLLDTLKPSERRLLSYASDLSVIVSAKPGPSFGRTRRVVATKGIIRQDVEERANRTYTIRNQDRERRLVVIEHPARSGWTVSGATPVESTAASHRFQAPVAPGETVTLSIDEARRTSSSFAVGKFDEAMVAVMSERPEDRDTIERAFRPVIDARAEVARLDAAIGVRRGELTTISADQTRLRENMKALGRSDSERRLLERYTGQLAAQEDRLEALQRELGTLIGEQATAAKRLDDVVNTLAIDLAF